MAQLDYPHFKRLSWCQHLGRRFGLAAQAVEQRPLKALAKVRREGDSTGTKRTLCRQLELFENSC
jgi:hypothetical protein